MICPARLRFILKTAAVVLFYIIIFVIEQFHQLLGLGSGKQLFCGFGIIKDLLEFAGIRVLTDNFIELAAFSRGFQGLRCCAEPACRNFKKIFQLIIVHRIQILYNGDNPLYAEGAKGMRILVMSDSHGEPAAVRRVLTEQPQAEAVIFCGDGVKDFWGVKESFPGKAFYMVRGNCDWGSQLELTGTITLEGVKFFYTHGHMYSVKATDYQVISAARDSKAHVLLFGHTHIPRSDYEDGLHILNPGSCSGYKATYGIVDVTKSGIVTNIISVKY